LCETRAEALDGAVESYVCEYRLKGDDGEIQWVEERGGWIGSGPDRRLISVIRSLESQKKREQHLSWLASNDELTGLLNRTHLRKALEDWMGRYADTEQRGAYLLAGIDDLGAINADFGFEVADEVIVAISKRLQDALGPDDLIGRVAGTKFGILVHNTDEEGVRDLCIQLLSAVRESVIDTKRGGVAASICLGAVDLPDAADGSQKAMTRAEAALDQARRLGHSSWSAFTEKTDQVSLRRRNTHMSDVILTALNERRIRLAFQPIVNDIGDAPFKYECLIRMRGEDGRNIP
ncbi:MAG: diguanylate cyclase, partial [Planctomycetota bacterium]